jgi:hypothetical protein
MACRLHAHFISGSCISLCIAVQEDLNFIVMFVHLDFIQYQFETEETSCGASKFYILHILCLILTMITKNYPPLRDIFLTKYKTNQRYIQKCHQQMPIQYNAPDYFLSIQVQKINVCQVGKRKLILSRYITLRKYTGQYYTTVGGICIFYARYMKMCQLSCSLNIHWSNNFYLARYKITDLGSVYCLENSDNVYMVDGVILPDSCTTLFNSGAEYFKY